MADGVSTSTLIGTALGMVSAIGAAFWGGMKWLGNQFATQQSAAAAREATCRKEVSDVTAAHIADLRGIVLDSVKSQDALGDAVEAITKGQAEHDRLLREAITLRGAAASTAPPSGK